MSVTEDDYSWSRFRSAEKIGDRSLYQLSPLALMDHAEDDKRVLEKEFEDNHIRYTVLSDPEHPEDDLSQMRWRLEYGAEFYFDGSAKEFLNVPDEIEDSENYARKIADDIFPVLEDRTLKYYGRKMLEA